jgi:hypothetical protein
MSISFDAGVLVADCPVCDRAWAVLPVELVCWALVFGGGYGAACANDAAGRAQINAAATATNAHT